MSSIPIRVAHGWALAWTDFMQAPYIAVNNMLGNVTGFFSETKRRFSSDFKYTNSWLKPVQGKNALGRDKQYTESNSSWLVSAHY